MAKKWLNEELDFLKKNYGVMPIDELCEYLGRSKPSIIHKADREDITAPRQWSDEEIQYLKDNYKTHTYKQLSEHLNRTKSAIDLKINRLGLVKSQYTYNHSFFKNIDTEEKAYWCGFIMADGNVFRFDETNICELCIKLQEGDADHLRKFNKSLEGNIPVTLYESANIMPDGCIHIAKMCQIRIYSEEMFHDIKKYGVIPNKSLIKEFPENIPENLIRHYIRGYFDGNGTVCLSGKKSNPSDKKYVRCSFATGSRKFAENLKNKLKKHNIETSRIFKKKDANCYTISICGMRNTDNFLKFIYDNSTIYLDRKFHKKNHLYKITNMEQRLLRQTEMSVHSRNESSGKEIGKPEMVIRMEGCTKDAVTCRA